MTVPQLAPVAVCALTALAVQVAAPPAWLVPVLLGLILLGGMPHGGLDILLATRRYPLTRRRMQLGFATAYLGLAAAVALLWWMAPTAALILFLNYSALHFGSDWTSRPGLPALAAGLSLLAQPALAASSETARLFSALGAEGETVQALLAGAGLLTLPFAVFAMRRAPVALSAFAGLGLIAVLLHPLAWFFVYFCGIHGPTHIRNVGRSETLPARTLARHWILPALIAAMLVASAGLLLWPRLGAEQAAMQAVFIGFAALTVPHMVLVDIVPVRRIRASATRP